MLWTVAAVHSLPVTLLDVVVAGFLAHLARSASSPEQARTTRLLCAWFVLLAFLNGCHVATCAIVEARASYLLNRVGESVSVLLSTVPLVAFAYAFIDAGATRAEARIVTALVAVAAGALSLVFVVQSVFLTADADLYYRVEVEHVETTTAFTGPWPLLLTLVVIAGYGTALVVLVRKGFAAGGRDRASAFLFAGVVAAAVIAAFINRLEGAG